MPKRISQYQQLWNNATPEVWGRVKVLHAECLMTMPGIKMQDVATTLLEMGLERHYEVKVRLVAAKRRASHEGDTDAK